MIDITSQDLTTLNTLHLKSQAQKFLRADRDDVLINLFEDGFFQNKIHFLGGGSNIVVPPVIAEPVLKIENKGIRILDDTSIDVLVKVKAGEVWHSFVEWAIGNNYGGIENLSLIPGTVGAAPIQNIGAYGVEVKDVIEEVICFDSKTGKFVIMTNEDCQFSYRDSVFKTSNASHLIVWEVNFRLTKNSIPKVSYGDIEKELQKNSWPTDVRHVSMAVINIRSSKLPDPAKIGNAGSFFKNPIVSENQKNELLKKYPQLVNYAYAEGNYKLAAGWLIEQAGWKGKSLGPVCMYEKQALVLVNNGQASSVDVWKLAEQVQQDVLKMFNVLLEPEPIKW